MLTKFRSLSNNVLTKSLLLALVVSLVIWGVKTSYGTKDYVALVGKNNYIYRENFVRAKKNYIRMLGQGRGNLEDANINQIVLDSLIQAELMKTESADLGMLIDDDVAFEEIRKMPVFKNEAGKFDPSVFKHALQANGIAESSFVRNVKEDLAVSILNSIFTTYQPSEAWANSFFLHEEQRRLVDLVTIRPMKSFVAPAIQARDIEQYYEAHKEQFTVNETRNVEYITITPTTYKNTIKLSAEELKTIASKKADKATVAKIKENLLGSKLAKAMHNDVKVIEDEIAEGISLKDISKKHKLQYSLIEKCDRSAASKRLPSFNQFVSQAFSIGADEVSEPIAIKRDNMSSGYYILNVPKIYPSHYKKLDDELKQQIQIYVQQELEERFLKEEALKLYNTIVSGKKTLEEALRENSNMSLEKISVGRTEPKGSNIDTNLLAMIFSAKDKNSYTNLAKSKEINAFQFAIVREIKLPALTPSLAKIQTIEKQLSYYLTDAIKQEFLSYLYTKYQVKVFPETIKEL